MPNVWISIDYFVVPLEPGPTFTFLGEAGYGDERNICAIATSAPMKSHVNIFH